MAFRKAKMAGKDAASSLSGASADDEETGGSDNVQHQPLALDDLSDNEDNGDQHKGEEILWE